MGQRYFIVMLTFSTYSCQIKHIARQLYAYISTYKHESQSLFKVYFLFIFIEWKYLLDYYVFVLSCNNVYTFKDVFIYFNFVKRVVFMFLNNKTAITECFIFLVILFWGFLLWLIFLPFRLTRINKYAYLLIGRQSMCVAIAIRYKFLNFCCEFIFIWSEYSFHALNVWK